MKKLILLMAILSVFLIGIVNAEGAFTCAIIEPDSGDSIADNTVLNVSFTGGEGNDTAQVSWYLSSPSTANSSASKLFYVATNDTGASANGSINFTFDSSLVLEDSNDYTVTAAMNGTACSGSATSVLVDRTAPSAPTTSHTSGTTFDDKDTTTITYTVTGTDTTGCRIAFLSDGGGIRFTGTNTFAMTHSGDSCTYTVTKFAIPDSTYNVYVQASDGTNTSTSVRRDYIIDTQASDVVDSGANVDVGGFVFQREQAKKFLFFGGGALLIYFLFFNKKGKKR